MCDRSGTLWSLCSDRLLSKERSYHHEQPTGGLTNHAVSHSFSIHLFFTKLSTSLPAALIITSSSGVARGELISDSIVTPHSARAGRHSGRVDGEGGGRSDPVNPHRPSCRSRSVICAGTLEKSMMGRRVQMRICSISGGTVGDDGC